MLRNPQERLRRLQRSEVRLGKVHPDGPDVYLTPRDRTQHLYSIGRSGFGKTTMLRNLIAQDLLIGHGLAVLAPDDQFFRDDLMPAIPEHRIQDVIYVDPEDGDRPIPLNPLHLAPGERLHEKVDETLRSFLRLVEGQADAAGAHRMQRILRHALATLIEIPGRTLLDFHRLLGRDEEGNRFRQWAAPQISDEVTRTFWQRDYKDFPKDAHQSVLSRLDSLLTPPVRNLLCTPGACLNFREAMDSNKVLLFRLTANALQGAGNAGVVGQLVVGKLNLAARSREDIREEDRRFFPIFIDEFQEFCGASVDDYRTMFSRLRKYGVPLTIAHLETGDFSEGLVRHILGTVSTFVFFQMNHSDAKRLSHEMIVRDADGRLVPIDPALLGSPPKGFAYCKVNGKVALVRMDPPRRGGSQLTVRRAVTHSRNTYGVPANTPVMPGRPPAPIPPGSIDDLEPGSPF